MQRAQNRMFDVHLKASTGDPNATPLSVVLVEHWFEEVKQRLNGK